MSVKKENYHVSVYALALIISCISSIGLCSCNTLHFNRKFENGARTAQYNYFTMKQTGIQLPTVIEDSIQLTLKEILYSKGYALGTDGLTVAYGFMHTENNEIVFSIEAITPDAEKVWYGKINGLAKKSLENREMVLQVVGKMVAMFPIGNQNSSEN